MEESTLVLSTRVVIGCKKCDLELADALITDRWPVDHPYAPPEHVLSVSGHDDWIVAKPVSKARAGCRYYGVSIGVKISCSCGLSTSARLDLLEQAANYQPLW
jgi:hypothetical protein